MSVKRIYATLALAGGLIGGLAACGTAQVPAAAPAVRVTTTVSPTPTVTKTVVPTPAPTITQTVVPVPARTVYAPAPVSAFTGCGGGVFAGPNTSCPFALNVEQSYLTSAGNPVDAYSPVTGSWYTMNCGGYDPVVCTGGNNATVEIY